MSKRQIRAISDDFMEVAAFFKASGVIPATPPPGMIQHAKRMHRATFSLILWKFRLKKLPVHGQVFIEEIASDALQILPQALMGYGKTAKLLTRGIIENVIRHIYFMDHPIEFERMNREHRWYPGLDELFTYPRIHPLFLDIESKFNALGRLRNLYDDLSAGVHGRRVQDLEMRAALEQISFVEAEFEKTVSSVEQCAESANFVMAVLHADQLAAFQLEDRQIILRSMSAGARKAWRGIA